MPESGFKQVIVFALEQTTYDKIVARQLQLLGYQKLITALSVVVSLLILVILKFPSQTRFLHT